MAQSKELAQEASPSVACPRCAGTGRVPADGITIGDRFLACRTKLGKTQGEISLLLRISRAQLANIEGDRSKPGLEMLVRAADLFGVSVDYLLGRP